ncbi:MAG: hypothetical protein NVS2B7_40990 [Herpetosiphon sp.]
MRWTLHEVVERTFSDRKLVQHDRRGVRDELLAQGMEFEGRVGKGGEVAGFRATTASGSGLLARKDRQVLAAGGET